MPQTKLLHTKSLHTETLLKKARAVQKLSYSPYSNFQVGAAISAENSSVHVGCNVENVSYPLGQCAEASAISAMIAAGSKKISEVLILSPNSDFCPPCGGCRQKIREFATADTLVHMANQEGQIKTVLLGELLPLAFESNKA